MSELKLKPARIDIVMRVEVSRDGEVVGHIDRCFKDCEFIHYSPITKNLTLRCESVEES